MAALRAVPGDRQLKGAALARLRAGDWAGLCDFIRSLEPQTAYAALRLLSSGTPDRFDLAPLLKHRDALTPTLVAAILLGQAWRHRGFAAASMVSESQWNEYVPRTAWAQELLKQATDADPVCGLAAAWRMSAFIDCEEEEKDDAEQALLRARRVPIVGWSNLLMARAKKWGGSHQEMFRIARSFAQIDRPGTLALTAAAHYERWLWDAVFEEDPDIAAMHHSYFENPRVWDELCEASAECLSGHHPDPRHLLFAHSLFARLFVETGAHRMARPHLRRLGSYADPGIWRQHGPLLKLRLNVERLKSGLLPAFG